MPGDGTIEKAVRTGVQVVQSRHVDVRSRRSERKVSYYTKVVNELFGAELRSARQPVWLDVGCGYGEALEAVVRVSRGTARAIGVEPMTHKAVAASARGLTVDNFFLEPERYRADFVSMIDIFSHIPDFRSILATVRSNLNVDAYLFLETGNLADIPRREDFPNELGLPDHLTFAGERQIAALLVEAGFQVLTIRRERIDGIENMIKNIVKRSMGRQSKISVPYLSRYRQLQFKAKLIAPR